MELDECYNYSPFMLMEGAIGERMKREYGILPDPWVALASHVYDAESRKALRKLFSEYVKIARQYRLPIMITTPTRRANKERVVHSKYDRNIIRDNVAFLKKIKQQNDGTVFVGGLMGCKGDAYKATEVLSVNNAYAFHSWAASLFRQAKVDFLYGGIMPALPEAIGMAKAMEDTGLPYIISFMIRDNGKLIDGTTIHDAIRSIDEATVRKPLCYVTNCVHPQIVKKALEQPFNRTNTVRSRFKGIQANTSPLSPEELDHSDDLKTSDPACLAADMAELHRENSLKIFGGCCGTDNNHMAEIAKKLNE
jgi:S-methylmethionine-dependent homocysteine/selenocysteine methylase